MKGTIVNFASIFIAGLLGLLVKGGIPERINKTIMNAVALAVIIIGISGSLKGENTLLMVISLAIGALIGEIIDIDNLIGQLAKYIESRLKRLGESNFTQGFIASTLLFCVGSMAIVGALNSGLAADHELLYTKSILDGISAFILSSTLGIGVIFSSFAVLSYQGLITLSATFLSTILSKMVILEISAVGSVLIMALGFNMLGISNIKVANILPSILIPVIYLTLF
ncbi:DUF554 domain-containing protein [Alloiococcus sp. CFN-8]|uniref:DUF554 domain-containing protein n=1 Tax=Alloiococcus sp. CFN-8 TaxID=3416081 RepID=UPI003CF6C22B